MVLLAAGVFICLLLFVMIFPFTSEEVSEAIGMEQGLKEYLGEILNKILPGGTTDMINDTVAGVLSGGVLSALYYILKIIGLLKKEEALKKQDLVEVLGQVMAERQEPGLPTLREFLGELSGKYAVVCPHCEAWNYSRARICMRCKENIRVKGVTPARIPLKEVFSQLVDYYNQMWGKYAEKKLNDDLIRAGVSPEESILALAEKIKSRVAVAA